MDNYVKVEYDDNGSVYYLNSKRKYHRLDGPAVVSKKGGDIWFLNGEFHRWDGPAYIYSNKIKAWRIYGMKYNQTQHNRLCLFRALEPMRITS